MNIKKTPKFWITVALVLCVISMLGASFVQTDGGKVTVKDLRWETSAGHMMSALLFIPDSATVENPAPAIVTSHGWYNNREMQDMNFVEYARRGYVVMSIDMYGHGNSDTLVNSTLAFHATGMTDAVELIAALPYVDKTRVGVTGHSNGARAAKFAVADDNLKETKLIKAVLLVANDATYQDKDKNYYNEYGSRDVGIVAAIYDEFFFRVPQADGSRSAPGDYINQATAQSFLNFGIDPATGEKRESYTMYKKMIDGEEAIRVIYNPSQIHPWNTISSNVVTSSIEFFEAALGAPNPIPAKSLVWVWKEIFNVLGLIGICLFVPSLAKILLDCKYFSDLKAAKPVSYLPEPKGSAKIWLWISLLLGPIFSAWSYIVIWKWVITPGVRPPFWQQQPVFFISMWAAVNALFVLLLIAIGWFFFGGKAVSMKERGLSIGWKNVWKTVVLALVVVFCSFLIVFISDYLFKVDFRLWVIPFKAFTPDKFKQIVTYLPFIGFFYVAHSLAVNSYNFVKMGKKEWINVAVLALSTVAGALVFVTVQYGTFFATGKSWTEVMTPPVSNIIGIWLFPLLVYFPLATIFDRMIFKVTKNPYLGGLIFGLIMTIMAVTNTLTLVP